MTLYCIELDRKTNRKYISYVDNNWYQTTFDPMYLWTEEECENLLSTFIGNYIWSYDIVDRDGNRKHICPRINKKPEPQKTDFLKITIESLSRLK